MSGLRATVKKDVVELKSMNVGSIQKFVSDKMKINFPGKLGEADDEEIAQLNVLYRDKKVSMAMLVSEIRSRKTISVSSSNFKLDKLKAVDSVFTIRPNAISFCVGDVQEKVDCKFGVADWSTAKSLDEKDVGLARAILAGEIACDAKVTAGKVRPILHKENAMFRNFGNEMQVAEAVDLVSSLKFAKNESVSGPDLATRIHKELQVSTVDDVKSVASTIHSADPPAVLAGNVHAELKYEQDGNIVIGSRRIKSFGKRVPKNTIARGDILSYARMYGEYVGETRAGLSLALTSFYFGCPMEGSMATSLAMLAAVNQLKDTTLPLVMDITNDTLAHFISQNKGRPVGYLAENNPSSEAEIRDAIKNRRVFRHGGSIEQDAIYLKIKKGRVSQHESKAEDTYGKAKSSLLSYLSVQKSKTVFYIDIMAMADYLGSDSVCFNIDLSPAGVDKKVDVHIAPSLRMHKLQCLGANFDAFIEPVKGLAMNKLFAAFMMNGPLYRYHMTPFSLIAEDTLPGKVPSIFRELRFVFAKFQKEEIKGLFNIDVALMDGEAIDLAWGETLQVLRKAKIGGVAKLKPKLGRRQEIESDDEADVEEGEKLEVDENDGNFGEY